MRELEALMRQRGFGYVEVVVVLAIVGALAMGARWAYMSGVEAGISKERAAWQKREITQQQTYSAELEKLRKAKDAELALLQGRLAKADADYQKKKEEANREKSKNDSFERELRAGRIMLVDPGGAGARKAGDCPGPADPATAGGGDGQTRPQPRGLSGELSASLWAEAGRADGLIIDLVDQLELAQNAVLAYYSMARACQAN